MNDDELMKSCRSTVAAWGAECLIDYAVTSLFTYYKDNPEEISEGAFISGKTTYSEKMQNDLEPIDEN